MILQEIFFSLITEVLRTAGKVSEFGVFSGPYFPVFGLNNEIYTVGLFYHYFQNSFPLTALMAS